MAPNFCCFCFENSSQLPLSIVAHSNLTSPPLEEPLEMTSCEMFFFFLKQGARRLSHEMEKVECFISFFYSDTDGPFCSSSLHGLSDSTATGSTPLESKQFIELHSFFFVQKKPRPVIRTIRTEPKWNLFILLHFPALCSHWKQQNFSESLIR